MISRRDASLALFAFPFIVRSQTAWADDSELVVGRDLDFQELTFPLFEALNSPELYGYNPPTSAQREKAIEIIDATPKGPTPFDVAKSFVTRFAKRDPDAISQWPAPQA